MRVESDVLLSYLPLYKDAALLTLKLGILGIILSAVVGFFCAVMLYLRVPVLKNIITCYVEVSRNTPLLVQLFFIYYGLPKIGIATDPAVCGVVGLTFLGGSYMCESFRSGLEAVEKIQSESAYSLGLNTYQVIRYIILPQAAAIFFPSFMANVIFLLKETSVFSAVSLMDLMFTAKDLIGLYHKTVECLFLLVVFYSIILIPVSLLGHYVERRLHRVSIGN